LCPNFEVFSTGIPLGPPNLKKRSKTGPNAYWVEVFLAKTPNFYITD
jgi:hypothetical protein